jgi:hypothetical protein
LACSRPEEDWAAERRAQKAPFARHRKEAPYETRGKSHEGGGGGNRLSKVDKLSYPLNGFLRALSRTETNAGLKKTSGVPSAVRLNNRSETREVTLMLGGTRNTLKNQ